MANELQVTYQGANSVYVIIQEAATGKAWNGSAFEVWADANLATYDIALSSLGGDLYGVDFPADIPAHTQFRATYYSMAGAAPSSSDTLLHSQTGIWDGNEIIDPSGLGARYGFLTIAEADAYFDTRLGASTLWTATTAKAAALQTAYNDLVNSQLFTLPTYTDVQDPLQIIQDAQCEQALFLLIDQDGIDRRSALRSQGVVFSGLVRESYRTTNGIAISTRAETMLKAYWLHGKGFLYTSPTLPE